MIKGNQATRMIQEEIKNGESDRLEFKRTMPKKDKNVLKTIVAFANGNGGKVVFGIDDKDQNVVGVDKTQRASLQDALTNMISDSCSPQIQPTYTWVEYQGKALLIVDIPASPACPYYIKSEGVNQGTYIRAGATTRRAEPEKIKELQLYGARQTYDATVEHASAPAGTRELDAVCQAIKEYAGKPKRPITVNQLEGWGLVERHGRKYFPSVAFRLLARNDLHFAFIQCARFKGTDRAEFVDRKTYDGPLYEQLENAQLFLMQHLICQTKINGFRREDDYEIPLPALREALANAFVHRNYLVHGCIQVSVFDNRVEILSPGGLYAHLTVEEMRTGNSRLRNPLLAAVLMRMNIIEQWGTGIQRMESACRQAGLVAPTYHVTSDSFCVTFGRQIAAKQQAGVVTQDLSQAEQEIYCCLMDNPHISVRSISDTTGKSKSTVSRIILKLIQAGMVARQGNQRNGMWIVK